jgi:hypothetical protein
MSAGPLDSVVQLRQRQRCAGLAAEGSLAADSMAVEDGGKATRV